MKFIETFVARPVATTLLTVGIALSGAIAYQLLPVSPLPQVDSPTINVSANVAGASPETMAATVATPLERALGRIAGVSEMTSNSSQGNTQITLQFDLGRDINGAARDVQAAINAARSLLPTTLTSNPTYRKVNPSDSPILILSLTSKTISRGAIYDAASSILAQKITQIDGVGDVNIGGGALPAVRIELDPAKVNARGLGLEQVRTAIANTNVNQAKGLVELGDRRWQVATNDQALVAKDYLPLIISYSNGAPVRLSDIGEVVDSVENLRNMGISNGEPAIVLQITRQPGANIIATVDRIKAMLPVLQASIPSGIEVKVAIDRSVTIRSSLHDVMLTLLISVSLVIAVVYLFLGSLRATLIPAVAVPVSLIGSFAVMYLADFSLNNLTLMALTIATGFVVDDAIVVLENVSRHMEAGRPRLEAALLGAREVGFTVLSMSLSLIAVFIPVLLMGGIVGRLFREFAITLSVAILVSLVISLTTTPMMCARVLPAVHQAATRGWHAWFDRLLARVLRFYERSLGWALRHGLLMLAIFAGTIGLSVYLYIVIPKGYFPQQDTGLLIGGVQADQSISFQAMRGKMQTLAAVIGEDPAIDTVTAFVSGQRGFMAIGLKPLAERKISADAVIARLRGPSMSVPGVQLFLNAAQDLRTGGRASAAQFQYTIQSDNLAELREWEPRIRTALGRVPELADVNTDSQDKGRRTLLVIDRERLAQLGLTIAQVDAVLYDAFGQRQVSTLYKSLNQYHVIMEVAPQFAEGEEALRQIYVMGAGGARIPLSTFAHYAPSNTALSVSHLGQFVATTISFNLPEGISLSKATDAINQALANLSAPSSIHGSFQGAAQAFQQSLANQPILILGAVLAVYIVLGILYESLIHPITILTTLPSAGVGALLTLLAFKIDFNVISFIGVLLLIGIVKKNAIMMIDFALAAERHDGLDSREAILRACLLRFRPIMMTTTAALLGALPLAIGLGVGSELRQPLGVAIVGGLVFSQALTLYTTPVVYLYFDRFQTWLAARRGRTTVGPVATQQT